MTAFKDHDHDRCIARGIAAAEALVESDGLRLTKVRRRVLEILLEEHRALGAYDILDRLREDGFAAQPPVAYRALDFLTQNGLVHRIERLNAYVACGAPERAHSPIFLICTSCGAVMEAGSGAVREAVTAVANSFGFSMDTCAIEAQGLCKSCAEMGEQSGTA